MCTCLHIDTCTHVKGMHVSCIHVLCLNVGSKSVADAFAYFGDASTTETERFIHQFDRLFDCLNVRSLSEWKMKAKPDLKPYTSPNDSRLTVSASYTLILDLDVQMLIYFQL